MRACARVVTQAVEAKFRATSKYLPKTDIFIKNLNSGKNRDFDKKNKNFGQS